MRYFLAKVCHAVGVIIAATMLCQFMLELAPGSVASVILEEGATPEAVEQLNRELGFDRPFFARYFEWLGNALQGDLGTSPLTNQSVSEAIRIALPVTVELVVLSVGLALVLALVAGVGAARRPGGLVDSLMGAVTSAALAFPAFVTAPVLSYFVAVRLEWVPVLGFEELGDGLWPNLQSVVLPVVCIALTEFAVFQRLLRGDMVATLQEDYIDSARGRGVPERRILIRHALRPAAVPLMTITGISVGRLLGGTVVLETFFSLPGVGSLLARSIQSRDLVMVQGLVVVIATVYVMINLVVDLAYAVIDPRIRTRAIA